MDTLFMNPNKFGIDMIGLQRQIFNGAYDNLIAMQDQQSKVLETLIDQATCHSEDLSNSLKEWITSFNAEVANFNVLVNHGFDTIEEILTDLAPSEAPAEKAEAREAQPPEKAPAKSAAKKSAAKSKQATEEQAAA